MCGDEFLIPPFPLPQRMLGAGYNGGNYYVGESELVGSVGLVSFQDSSHVQAKDSRMGDGQTARALRGGGGREPLLAATRPAIPRFPRGRGYQANPWCFGVRYVHDLERRVYGAKMDHIFAGMSGGEPLEAASTPKSPFSWFGLQTNPGGENTRGHSFAPEFGLRKVTYGFGDHAGALRAMLPRSLRGAEVEIRVEAGPRPQTPVAPCERFQ